MTSKLSPKLGALALAKSLFPHIQSSRDLDEFLLYPPDLFAFTSLIFSVTGSYRLIVSPPRDISGNSPTSRREIWMPTENENLKNYSEFDEESGEDFKDIGGLIAHLFYVDNHKISKLLRTKMSPEDITHIMDIFSSDPNLGSDENKRNLEKKSSQILNQIIKLDSLYDENESLFENTHLSDEFWDVLEQLKESAKKKKPNADERIEREEMTKRLHRLLLEAVYPNEIESSLSWDKRVRKVGLEWRKNLKGFKKDRFEELKKRTEINELEERIENLKEFRYLLKERARLGRKPENSEETAEIDEGLSNIAKIFDVDVDSLSSVYLKKLKDLDIERSDKLAARLGEVRNDIDRFVPKTLRTYWNSFKGRIDPVRKGNIWDLLCEQGTEEERKDHWRRFVSLVSMHAIADEACAGWGIRGPLKILREGFSGTEPNAVKIYAEELLQTSGTMATISHDRCRILPKRHTAEVGITLRSVSCNLAYHRSSVNVNWKLPHNMNPLVRLSKPTISSLNVLLLPVPLEIHTTDFKRKTVPVKSHQLSQDYFEYDPKVFGAEAGTGNPLSAEGSEKFKDRIKDILKKAREEVGRVDMVILPEAAIHQEVVDLFEKALLEESLLGEVDFPVTSYIAGVRESGERFSKNAVYFKISEKKGNTWQFNPDQREAEETLNKELAEIYDLPDDHPEKYENIRKKEERLLTVKKNYTQYKHHRWKLEKSQIVQYQLGGALSPTKVWWEAIKIGNREVNFVNIGDLLTVCPLICEDLARQDPIADLIRTVGPTLVVSILMDGPQLLKRWAAKYASVLGDDPGSAVITLTSYGMVRRSLVEGFEPSRIIALWSSPEAKVEIELEEGAEAVLLSLSVDERKEKAADGREEIAGTPSLSLGGIRQIKLGDFETAERIFKC
jgi:hypothetical protein